MKNVVRACLIALVVVLLLLGLAAWYGWSEYKKMAAVPASGSHAPAVALISSLTGTAMVTRSAQTKPLALHDDLYADDVVQVGPSSTVAIIWPDYGRTLLDSDSKLDIREAVSDSAHGSLRVRLLLEAGRVWTRLQKLLGTDSAFTVQASDVIATVRGTSFGLDRLPNQPIALKVRESKVAVLHAPSPDADVTEDQMQAMMPAAQLVQQGEAMDMTPGAKAWPAPRAMTQQEMNEDAFMTAGHEALTEAELHLQTVPDLQGVDLDKLWNSLPPWLQDILRKAVDQQKASG